MIRAKIRRDIDHFRIPALSLSGELDYIFTHEEFDAEQPDMIEDEEYKYYRPSQREALSSPKH